MNEETTYYERTVALVSDDAEPIEGIFRWNEPTTVFTLTLRYDGKELLATADDYFDALSIIRNELEVEGRRPYCYGASRYAWPSDMSRTTGFGLDVYKIRFGHRPSFVDLVGIFDTGPDIEPASVNDQLEFAQQWFDSLS